MYVRATIRNNNRPPRIPNPQLDVGAEGKPAARRDNSRSRALTAGRGAPQTVRCDEPVRNRMTIWDWPGVYGGIKGVPQSPPITYVGSGRQYSMWSGCQCCSGSTVQNPMWSLMVCPQDRQENQGYQRQLQHIVPPTIRPVRGPMPAPARAWTEPPPVA